MNDQGLYVFNFAWNIPITPEKKTFLFTKPILTWSDFKPAVGVWSVGFDSGMGSFGSAKCMPGQPTHKPLPLITTGQTAVTRPPALKISEKKKNKK